jgi:hypothetical protein
LIQDSSFPAPRASNQQSGSVLKPSAPVVAKVKPKQSHHFSEVIEKYLPLAPEGL